MHNMFNNRDVLKWSLLVAEAAVTLLAIVPRLTESRERDVQPQVREPVPTGDFGLLLLDEDGSVLGVHSFTAGDVRSGYVRKEAVQQAAKSVGASGAVMTYQSPGLVVDNPADYRDVIRGIHQALTEIDVRLLSRALLEGNKA